jgi:hypothetical protein
VYEIEEEVVVTILGEDEDVKVGTGAYLVRIKTYRFIPNLLPMHGLKVKFSYRALPTTGTGVRVKRRASRSM